jgi:hypothetical protein
MREGRNVRRVHIRAGSDGDVACLMRELSVYSPKQLRGAVVIELQKTSHTDLLALLSAVETCLMANDIRAVRIAIDGKAYMMAPTARR